MLLLGRGTAEEKFVEFIINWRARLGRKGALANLVPLPMYRRDIADYLGLTIETISRLLAKLERENVVHVIPEGLQLIGPTERPLLFERRLQGAEPNEHAIDQSRGGSICDRSKLIHRRSARFKLRRAALDQYERVVAVEARTPRYSGPHHFLWWRSRSERSSQRAQAPVGPSKALLRPRKFV
jgi:hypothetical protein